MGKYKNNVSLIGTVGKDPQTYRTPADVPYTRFSLATSEGGYKLQDGTDVPEVTQWHNVIAWRQLADVVAKYVRKGMKLAVDGKIVYGEYDKQGVKCTTVDIVASDIVMMSKPGNSTSDPQTPVSAPANTQQANAKPQQDLFDDVLPF